MRLNKDITNSTQYRNSFGQFQESPCKSPKFKVKIDIIFAVQAGLSL